MTRQSTAPLVEHAAAAHTAAAHAESPLARPRARFGAATPKSTRIGASCVGGHLVRRLALCAALSAFVCLAGCGKGVAGGLTPDFAGVWDVTYDDSVEVAFTHGEQDIRSRVDELGGQVSVRDAGVALDLEVDCTRPELVCPAEVWPRELSLRKPPGKVDREGVQLAQPIVGAGFGRCTSKPGSHVTGEIMSIASAHSIRPEAVALTAGRVSVVVDASCFAPHAGLPAGTLVTLSTGYTAAKR